jgi:hypothetical protein
MDLVPRVPFVCGHPMYPSARCVVAVTFYDGDNFSAAHTRSVALAA